MAKRAMICQPMNGIKVEEIKATRDRAISWLHENGFTVENSLFTEELHEKEIAEQGVVCVPLCYLAKSLEVMSKCDVVYFCKGWNKARGCQVEHFAAKSYGLKVLYEE